MQIRQCDTGKYNSEHSKKSRNRPTGVWKNDTVEVTFQINERQSNTLKKIIEEFVFLYEKIDFYLTP